MRLSSILVPLLVVALIGAVGFGALRAFSGGGPGSDDNFLLGENWPAGNAADSIPYDGDMLEQSTGIIYPYATDPTDSEYGIELILEPGGAPQFVEPDQALLDAASVLPCPDGASDNAVVNLALVLCLPSAWTVESFEQTVDGVRTASVTLYAEPDLSSFPSGSSDGVVTTSLTILQQDGGWPDLACPAPGVMAMPEGNATVCFYAEQVSADDDIEYRTRVLVFNLPSGDGDAELWAFITSTRVLGDAPIGMQDASFREALAILANMRFE